MANTAVLNRKNTPRQYLTVGRTPPFPVGTDDPLPQSGEAKKKKNKGRGEEEEEEEVPEHTSNSCVLHLFYEMIEKGKAWGRGFWEILLFVFDFILFTLSFLAGTDDPLPEAKKNRRRKKKKNKGREDKKTSDSRVLYLFYEMIEGKHVLRVYAVDTSDLSIYPVTKLRRTDKYRMGYIAYDSKLYAIGGEYTEGSGWGYPRDVLICDLGKKRPEEEEEEEEEGGAATYKWERGPSLNSGKPLPMVVAVMGRIYALAGRTLWWDCEYPEIIDPAFEVLDAEGWCKLPNPPFYSYYREFPGPSLLGHTVVGNNIYVRVRGPGNKTTVGVLYSFNVITEEWKEHAAHDACSGGIGNLIANNLKKWRWTDRADVVDDKLYTCATLGGDRCVNVYAYDLAPPKLEEPVGKVAVEPASTTFSKDDDVVLDARGVRNGDSLPWDCDSEPDLYYEDDAEVVHPTMVRRIILPVKSMIFGDPSCYALVTYLGDQMFLVVCFYFASPHRLHRLPYGNRYVYTCTFKIAKEESNIPSAEGSPMSRDCAVIVNHKFHALSSRLTVPDAWFTM